MELSQYSHTKKDLKVELIAGHKQNQQSKEYLGIKKAYINTATQDIYMHKKETHLLISIHTITMVMDMTQ